MQHSVIFKNSTLCYQKSGHGKKVLLLFHGFGQHRHAFVQLTETLAPHYTLYSFDLFFHGQSQWALGEQPLEKAMWNEIMIDFLSEHEIKNFNLMGYSLGGKFVLATLELFPTRIDHIFLLAPDGIKTNFWYSLATYPLLLRRFFKSMILKPGRLHTVTTLLYALRIVDNSLLRFAKSQMDTQEKRKRVYCSWVVFRHLKFNMKKIAGILNGNTIGLTMVVGKHDKIITEKNMERLLRYVNDHQLEILDTGHNGVIDGIIPLLKKAIGL